MQLPRSDTRYRTGARGAQRQVMELPVVGRRYVLTVTGAGRIVTPVLFVLALKVPLSPL